MTIILLVQVRLSLAIRMGIFRVILREAII